MLFWKFRVRAEKINRSCHVTEREFRYYYWVIYNVTTWSCASYNASIIIDTVMGIRHGGVRIDRNRPLTVDRRVRTYLWNTNRAACKRRCCWIERTSRESAVETRSLTIAINMVTVHLGTPTAGDATSGCGADASMPGLANNGSWTGSVSDCGRRKSKWRWMKKMYKKRPFPPTKPAAVVIRKRGTRWTRGPLRFSSLNFHVRACVFA